MLPLLCLLLDLFTFIVIGLIDNLLPLLLVPCFVALPFLIVSILHLLPGLLLLSLLFLVLFLLLLSLILVFFDHLTLLFSTTAVLT